MYSTHRLPLAISHRGLRSAAPENSIPAFLAAIDAGAEGIELDVHASADDVLFVHHDPDVPVDGVRLPIRSLESGRIRPIRIEGETHVPTLDETLDLIGARCDVFIEIKAAGIETAVARCLRRHADTVERYAVHAFDHRVVKRMLELIPSVRTGILQVSYLIDSCAALRRAGALDLWQHTDFIDESLVIDAHACGARVVAWTSNSPSQWEKLSKLRVDGVCTDRVDEYVAWKSAQG